MTNDDVVRDGLKHLIRLVEDDLDARPDVVDYAISEDDVTGLLVEVEDGDAVRLYHITLETRPPGKQHAHWSYLGEKVA